MGTENNQSYLTDEEREPGPRLREAGAVLPNEAPETKTASPARLKVLKVPLDNINPDQLPDLVNEYLSPPIAPVFQPGISSPPEKSGAAMPLVPPAHVPSNEGRNIVLLSVWDLLRARRNGEYRSFILNAALVLPISKSLVSGARFLTGKTPYRYMPFNFVIGLLGIMEQREYTAYLLGGKRQSLEKTEKNLRRTFPALRIVGRFSGSFKKQNEGAILKAIQKAAPHLILVGKGVRGGELWIARNHFRLGSGIRLWCSDLFDIFAEKRKRPSEAAFEKGLEALGYCARNPLKFARIFPYLRYKILLLIYKIFGFS